MKRFALVSVAAFGAALLIGFAFGGLGNVFQGPAPLSSAVIAITGVPGKCVATTDPQLMSAKRNQKVDWKINDPSRCLPENVEVEIRFTNGGPFWFSSRANGKTAIDKLIQPFARLGRPYYHYEVWAVGPGTEYKMEDPELEMVQ